MLRRGRLGRRGLHVVLRWILVVLRTVVHIVLRRRLVSRLLVESRDRAVVGLADDIRGRISQLFGLHNVWHEQLVAQFVLDVCFALQQLLDLHRRLFSV